MSVKYIFVTGGVVSGLGKGHHRCFSGPPAEGARPEGDQPEAGSLPERGPGHYESLSARQVFVTDDGAETDLDLGHYERASPMRT